MESTPSLNPDPIPDAPHPIHSASLILLTEPTHRLDGLPRNGSPPKVAKECDLNPTDHQIRHYVRTLGSAGWSTQVLLVDRNAALTIQPTQRSASNGDIADCPVPPVFPSIADAISAAQHATIVIADPSQLIEPGLWSVISGRLCYLGEQNPHRANVDLNSTHSPIQCVFEKPDSISGLKRVLLTLYLWLLRVLLKTNKSEFQPGVVVTSKDQCKLLFNSTRRPPNHGSLNNLTELLAIARLNQIPIEETETRRLGYASGNSPVRCKQIMRSMRRSIRFWWSQIVFPLSVHDDPARQKIPAAKVQWAAGFLLLAGISAILLSNLNYPLFEPDEARNAQLAMNIIESGDWLSLTLAEEPYWDKPPAQIWAIATSYQIFGISPAATRIPGALATGLSILLTFFLGRQLIGFRPAFLGAIALLLSSGFVLLGRYVTMDASLTCCLVLMTLSLMLAGNKQSTQHSRSIWLVLAGIAAGLGLLVKGPVILVLGIPPIFVAYWLAGQIHFFKHKRLLFFALPMLVIAVPWYLATAIVHPDFLVYFFWKHHVVRFSDAFNHREPFYYYLPAIFLMMFPVSYLLPSLIKFLATRRTSVRNMRTSAHGFLCLTSLWIIGFFSISESKLPTYILPALPSICLLCGVLLDKKIFVATSPTSAASPFTAASATVTHSFPRLTFLQKLPQRSTAGLVVLSAAMIVVMKLASDAELPSQWLLLTGGAVLGTAALLSFRKSRKPRFAWAGLALAAFGFVLVSITWLTPNIAQTRSLHGATMAIKSQPEMTAAPILFFGREDFGAEMVIPAADIHRFADDEMADVCLFLEQHPQAIIISSKEQVKNLRKALIWTIRIDASERARHLYVSHPAPNSRNRPRTAKQPGQAVR